MRLILSVCSLLSMMCVMAGITRPAMAQPVRIEHAKGVLELPAPATRVAVTNWAFTETVIALGMAPVAIADPDAYYDWVGEPALPPGFTDIGARNAPNLEALRAARPDLIIISRDLEMAYDTFSEIAPTLVLPMFEDGVDALPVARDVMEKIAIATGRQDIARNWLADADRQFDAYGARIRAAMPQGHKLTLVNFISEKHISLFGTPSLPGGVLAHMGLPIGYDGPVNKWGFAKGGIEILAPQAHDTLLYLNPVPDVLRARIWASPLWKVLEFTRQNRVYELPVVWAYGGMPSALRMARYLAESLEHGPVQ